MTCRVFLKLENYEYVFIRLFFFFLWFSVAALCIFSPNISASYMEVIFYGHPGVSCLGDVSEHICFQNAFENPPRSPCRQ